MPKKQPERQLEVGYKIRVSMHGGKIVDAVIKALIEHKDGLRFQVAFGLDQTALIGEWQIAATFQYDGVHVTQFSRL